MASGRFCLLVLLIASVISVAFADLTLVDVFGDVGGFGNSRTVTLDDGVRGARFQSAEGFTTGTFSARIKTPGGQSSGVVTGFYLQGGGDFKQHGQAEIDFEFLGSKKTQVQLNVYGGGQPAFAEDGTGHFVDLGFDHSGDFHEYKIVVTPDSISWFADGTLLYSFSSNNPSGVYPSRPMNLFGSIYDGSQFSVGWAGETSELWGTRQPRAATHASACLDAP